MGIKVSAVQRLVNRIESDFETENWIDGELIGTEDELCANYQVSPTVVRQAARVLESSGFAVMRPVETKPKTGGAPLPAGEPQALSRRPSKAGSTPAGSSAANVA